MKWLDLTLPTPAENLACDEALLDSCDEGGEDEILRWWESRQYFVVVGYGERAESEVDLAACAARNIPVLRRTSGGGTVLQGPGCLNYSLILKIDAASALRGIVSTNRYVMERNRAALQSLVASSRRRDQIPSGGFIPESGEPKIEVRGHTDLVTDGRKFSGNAQRRKKRFLLFHGTLLLNFELRMIEETLPLPSRQPVYRQHRSHKDFLTNLGLSAGPVKQVLREAWNAVEPFNEVPMEKIALLARDKYATDEWNLKL
jgi:lipoate-protein ligase A